MYFKLMSRGVFIAFTLMWAMNAKAQTLVWSDEFNQPKLDAEKWTTEVGGSGFGNGELQYYTSGESNVFIGSKTSPSDTGYLVIEARRENYGVAPENKQFTSGRLHTSGKFNFKYGTIEARIKLPDLQNGLWPAFWMLGANYPTVGWPKSGEIDILEAGFRDDWQNGVANKKASTTVHWFQDNYLTLVPNAHELGWWGNASATGSTTIEGSFNDGYHLFKLTWTPTEIRGYVDNTHFYTFAIPESDANITEFNHPFYIIMNLAVGGSNFVGITDPQQITAPMPAQMEIDYVRVYSNENTETFHAASLPRETGNFGVFTETTSVTNSLGSAPQIDVWNNLSAASSSAQEGSAVLAFTANPGNWFGMGIPTGSSGVKNMQNFIDGSLHFHMKTTSTWPMSIGVISSANGNAQPGTQEKSVRLDPAGNQYGLVRDGEWHEVIIPLSAFGNIEFRSINNMFYLVGDNPSSPVTFAIDNIYWADGTKITPQNGDYVIYADNHAGVDTFNLGTDGQFYVWEATLNALPTTPAEGANVLSFTHNNKGWFGAAFTATAMHNLTAFQNAEAKLVFSLKTSDTSTPFNIGMKSGTRDGEGQKWITFDPAQTPYGFQRNGTWQVVEIPMSDFYSAVNLMEVTQMFEILGVGNISDIAIDNIYLTGGGTALPDVGSNAVPVANAGPNLTVRFPADSVVIAGSATDSDGSIGSYAWTVQSGPNAPVLSGDSTASLMADGLIAGVYVFRLRVTDDDGATGFDDVSVFVGSNISPTAYAGADKTISLPGDSVVVHGSGSDTDGSIASYLWNTESGPNSPTLLGGSTSTLSATGLIEGTYEFKLTVTDNEGAASSDVVVVVVTPNSPPTANAGSDQSISLPTNSITMEGSGTDTGAIVSYSWSVTSGPNTPVLSGENTPTVTASNLVVGTYLFNFIVTDNGGLTASDSVIVVVNEAPINIALLKPVTVSSVENAGTPGSAAVDGNLGSRWSSAFSDPQWLYVDLGETYTINTIKITWEGAYGKDYKVEISDDASNWSTIKTIVGNTSLVNEHSNLYDSGRYVRIYGTQRATPYGYSIFELEVYGEPNSAPSVPVANAGPDQTVVLPNNSVSISGSGSDSDGIITDYSWVLISGPTNPILTGENSATLSVNNLVAGTYVFSLTVTDNDSLTASDDVTIFVNPAVNLAFMQPVMFSSAETPGTLGAQAVDGNLATRWSSAFTDPQWIYVDLGDTYSINTVKIYWEGAMGRDYRVEFSDDANSWTTAKTITGNTSLINTHSELSGSARYVRIYGTVRATPYGYSIYELEVYGDPIVAPSAPVGNAGSDQTIAFPQNSVTIYGSGSDSDGTIIDYSWSLISGPTNPVLTGENTSTLIVNELAAGTYVFSLTVTDNDSLTASDDVTIVVNSAINLALFKPVMFSSAETPGTLGALAVDGNITTRWSSAFTDPQWIYVDLGDTYSIDRVKITWEPAYGKDYLIELSDDANTWTAIKAITGNTSLVNDHMDISGTGRYVRIYGTARATPWGYSIYELEVYGNSNAAPTASAGDDIHTNFPDSSIVLYGVGADSDGTIASYSWTMQSGPNAPVLSGDNTETLTANGLIPGAYVFTLTVTDNDGATAYDDVVVYVNSPPTVNAGIDTLILLPLDTVTVFGSANDMDGTISGYFWSLESGPNNPVMINDSTAVLTAAGLVTGTYIFRLTVTDNNGAVGFDEVVVNVEHSNFAPTASAGDDVTIQLPVNSVILNGTGTDIDGTIVSYSWNLQNGPNSPTLTNADSASLFVNDLVAGTYEFTVTVTDNDGATGTDLVLVTVEASANLALLKPVTVSSTKTTATPGSAAVDGNTDTKWISAYNDRQWIYVDLGATYNIDRVQIIWGSALGKHYDIQVSMDALSWKTIKAVKANKKLVNDYSNLSASARFVRIYGTKSGTDFGYSISELEVYGASDTESHARLKSSIEKLPSSEVNFYPNPAKDMLHVAGLKNGTEVRMMPATGTIPYRKTIVNESLDISDIPSGLYILDCYDGVKLLRKKIIKE